MLYKILNFIFGYDYIYWKDSASQGIARVRVLEDGTVYYWYSVVLRFFEEIETPDQVKWLTCSSNKYFKET